jgi:murein DD-endopeptidase MepM/ murein hydrolase activator NlpD
VPPPVDQETVLLKATVAVRRAIARLRRDTTDPEPREQNHRRLGLGLARRADTALRTALRRSAAAGSGSAASSHDRLQARPPSSRLVRLLQLLRLASPERAVPILVAVFLLVASLTAAPGLVGAATGATSSIGTAPRLVVGGAGGPNDGQVGPIDTPSGANDGSGPTGGTGSVNGAGVDPGVTGVASDPATAVDPGVASTGAGDASTGTGAAASVGVAGQFLEDGTLLKPVVVDTTVVDGRTQLRTYTVRSGDTLTGIASKTGVSMMTIWWANKLTAKDQLKVGQQLVIPPVDGLVVTVGPNDTLASVAAAHGLDPAEIVATNQLTDTTLVIGQVLILPGAHGAAIPTPKPVAPTISRVTSRTSSGVATVAPLSDYSGGRFAWPVPGGFISQYFHYGHPAIDIAADWGSPIEAAAAGVVTFAGWRDNGGGYQVWISHGSGLYTTYNHLSSVAVAAGTSVGRGDFIGRVGATGNATGPHCHFEVWIGPIWDGGVRVNPLAYF